MVHNLLSTPCKLFSPLRIKVYNLAFAHSQTVKQSLSQEPQVVTEYR
jgi:hypothetical protein